MSQRQQVPDHMGLDRDIELRDVIPKGEIAEFWDAQLLSGYDVALLGIETSVDQPFVGQAYI
jgi:hypothetical protein